MRKLITFSVFVILLGGCGKNSQPTDRVLNIDLTQQVIPIQKTGIIKKMDIIPLEIRDGELVGEIDKLIIHDNRIYIADYWQAGKVQIFNMDGSLEQVISRRGRGPGEYIDLASIFIDTSAKRLNLVNAYPPKILSFGLDGDGNPDEIELKNVMPRMSDMAFNEDGYFAYTQVSFDGNRNNIYIFDKNYKKLDSQIEFPQGWDSNEYSGRTKFSKYNKKLYFKPIYEHVIYKFTDEKFEPAYILDFGRYNIPAEIVSAEAFRNSKEEFVTSVYNFQETDDYWLVHILHQGQDRLIVVDKATGKSTVCFLEANDTPYFISFGRIRSITENHIITTVEAANVSRLFEDEEFLRDYPEQLKRLREKVGDIKPYDNPVLVVYEI